MEFELGGGDESFRARGALIGSFAGVVSSMYNEAGSLGECF